MKSERFYDLLIRSLAVFFVAIGVIILGLTLFHGGGPISTGFLIGLAFIGIGVARWRIQSKIVGRR